MYTARHNTCSTHSFFTPKLINQTNHAGNSTFVSEREQEMVAKCGGITQIALMEVAQVGVRTRARAAILAATAATKSPTGETTVKRRKITRTEIESSSSSLVQFSTQQSTVTAVENKILQANVESEDRCSSPISNQFLASSCSSNRSSELDGERRNPVDLEVEVEFAKVETSTCNYTRQRKKMSNSSELQTKIDELESTVKPPPETNPHRTSMVKCRPTELELEEFFVAAEKDIQKKFADKYNFDILNDVPLEGPYEWVLLERKQKYTKERRILQHQ